MLVAEFDLWLKFAKIVRLFSLFWALIYNVGFICLAIIGFEKYEHWEKIFGITEPPILDVYVIMFVVYNFMMHFYIFLINCSIMLKEFSMEFYQFAFEDAGKDDDDVSLGFHDMVSLFFDMGDFFNPLNYRWS